MGQEVASLKQVLSVNSPCEIALVNLKDYQCCAKWLEVLNTKLSKLGLFFSKLISA